MIFILYKQTVYSVPLLCVHTAAGESVKVAGSHSFPMSDGMDDGASWMARAAKRVEVSSTLWEKAMMRFGGNQSECRNAPFERIPENAVL